MPNYNFQNLSPYEFEELSRDLLQKHLNIVLESFTIGRDGGIDFRYSISNTNDIIIQCKKYDKFTQLMSNLKKEVAKVRNKSPLRYILVTSVGLTDENKKTITKLFSPYVKNTSDIFGKDDLNNLLGIFPTIEKNHFKLWLSSTNILDKILNSKTYNQSSFELEKIQETIKVYVDNDSYYRAIDIIKDRKHVIISGIPGIGKTTLARILASHYLAIGFEEFIFLSDSINEGFSLYKDGIKQIFLFDDFLGKNFLENKLNNNEEQRIIQFIDKIKKSKDKIIIFTTREYILSQARQKYDVLNSPSIELAKCIIDLSQYTKLVRAKILYNHMYFSNLPEEYILDIVNNQNYKRIIEHRNYNPRIIETILNEDIWESIDSKEFFKTFLNFIENPQSVWKHVFESQISNLSRMMLAILMTAEAPILLNDLIKLTQAFSEKFSKKYDIPSYEEIAIKKSLKELENTFIRISKDSEDTFKVDYMNPSIQDFLVFYFKNHIDCIKDIIETSLYFNQLFRVFSYLKTSSNKVIYKISLNNEMTDFVIDKLIKNIDSWRISSLSRSYPYRKEFFSDYIKLNIIVESIDINQRLGLKQIIIDKFQNIISVSIERKLYGEELSAYINLMRNFKEDVSFDLDEVLSNTAECIVDIGDFEVFEEFEEIFGDDYLDTISLDQVHRERIETLIDNEIENADRDHLDYLKGEVKRITTKYQIDYSHFEDAISDKIDELDELDNTDYWEDNYPQKKSDPDEVNDLLIKNIFDSLIQ